MLKPKDKTKVTINLNTLDLLDLKKIADEQDIPYGRLIRQIIKKYLSRRKQNLKKV